jgi:hypothetical protein
LSVFKAIMRIFSYLFHAVLALFLLVVSVVALVSGPDTLHLGMLPWSGTRLTYILFSGSLLGLLSVLLALFGKLRPLFFLWSLAVAVLLVKGYIFSHYRLWSGELDTAIYLIAASLAAVLGAWFQMWRRPERMMRY